MFAHVGRPGPHAVIWWPCRCKRHMTNFAMRKQPAVRRLPAGKALNFSLFSWWIVVHWGFTSLSRHIGQLTAAHHAPPLTDLYVYYNRIIRWSRTRVCAHTTICFRDRYFCYLRLPLQFLTFSEYANCSCGLYLECLFLWKSKGDHCRTFPPCNNPLLVCLLER